MSDQTPQPTAPEPPEITATAQEIIPIDSVQPHPENPRRGTVSVLKESIIQHGQYRPIVVQRSTNLILAGNHTWMAAQEAGMTSIAVTYVDVDDAEARRILLVDNRASDLGTYDNVALVDLLQNTNDDYGDLLGTGYDDAAFQDLLKTVQPPDAPPEFPTIDPETLPTTHECPRCGYEWS